MSDMLFENLLAEFNEDYKNAEEYSDWMPDDGEYIVSIIKCAKDTSEKDGKKMAWWKLTARIESPQDEQLNGQEFTLGFYSSNNFGILKGQARALNGGEVVPSLAEADKVFESAIGNVYRVKIIITTSSKNGKEYTNCYVQEKIATEGVEDAGADEAPPQDTEQPQS